MRHTAKADAQIDALRLHFLRLDRIETARGLAASIERAEHRIETDPECGLHAPPPYPDLARPRRRWFRSGRYWFFYSDLPPPVLLGVFYDASDIPERLPED